VTGATDDVYPGAGPPGARGPYSLGMASSSPATDVGASVAATVTAVPVPVPAAITATTATTAAAVPIPEDEEALLRFPALTRVRIKGLVGAHELNDTIGFVRHEAIEQGRVPIQCAGQDRSVRVKLVNLEVLPNQIGARVQGMRVRVDS
jgi:hypothetical protein